MAAWKAPRMRQKAEETADCPDRRPEAATTAGAALAKRAAAILGDSGCRSAMRRNSTSQKSRGNRDLHDYWWKSDLAIFQNGT